MSPIGDDQVSLSRSLELSLCDEWWLRDRDGSKQVAQTLYLLPITPFPPTHTFTLNSPTGGHLQYELYLPLLFASIVTCPCLCKYNSIVYSWLRKPTLFPPPDRHFPEELVGGVSHGLLK